MKNLKTVVVLSLAVVVALIFLKIIFKIGFVLLIIGGVIWLLMQFGGSANKQ